MKGTELENTQVLLQDYKATGFGGHDDACERRNYIGEDRHFSAAALRLGPNQDNQVLPSLESVSSSWVLAADKNSTDTQNLSSRLGYDIDSTIWYRRNRI